MDIDSRPSRKRAADVQTEVLEDSEQMDANESAASLPQAEGESSDERMLMGNWKRTTNVGKTQLPEMDTWASTRAWTSRQRMSKVCNGISQTWR